MNRMTFPRLATLMILWAGAAHGADAPSLCATPEQAAQVRAAYAQPPHTPAFLAAPKLALPEGIVLSALPPEQAIGTSGSAFLEVWQSLQGWDRSLTLVLKAGQVFEIYGRVPPGEPSNTSQFYNLTYPEAGLGGHLRPDLIAAIYAVSLTTREGSLRGITFLDAKGDNAFNVFLPESRKPTPAEDAQFEKTRALVKALPRLCPSD
jgi:putative heme iron utilization protein